MTSPITARHRRPDGPRRPAIAAALLIAWRPRRRPTTGATTTDDDRDTVLVERAHLYGEEILSGHDEPLPEFLPGPTEVAAAAALLNRHRRADAATCFTCGPLTLGHSRHVAEALAAAGLLRAGGIR